MFRAIERHQLHAGRRAQTLDQAVEARVHTTWIGEQSEAFAANQIQMFFKKDFGARFDRHARGRISAWGRSIFRFTANRSSAAGASSFGCCSYAKGSLAKRIL